MWCVDIKSIARQQWFFFSRYLLFSSSTFLRVQITPKKLFPCSKLIPQNNFCLEIGLNIFWFAVMPISRSHELAFWREFVLSSTKCCIPNYSQKIFNSFPKANFIVDKQSQTFPKQSQRAQVGQIQSQNIPKIVSICSQNVLK